MERERKGGKRVGVSVEWADGSTFLGQMGSEESDEKAGQSRTEVGKR